jgi:hypothetical protein
MIQDWWQTWWQIRRISANLKKPRATGNPCQLHGEPDRTLGEACQNLMENAHLFLLFLLTVCPLVAQAVFGR